MEFFDEAAPLLIFQKVQKSFNVHHYFFKSNVNNPINDYEQINFKVSPAQFHYR